MIIGNTISHYKILEKLGEGGMGVVYKAQDTKLKRTVALKFLPAELTQDPEAKKRFIYEAQAAATLKHHNICTIHEIDETEDGQTFIAMDCYEGQTLKEIIENGPLKLEEAVEIVIQIARGLAKAHEQDVVHRDIKPANIMIDEDGVAKIMDFGLAKSTGRTKLTKTGTTVGTVAYMSPEQAKGEEVDHHSDIWSLGVILYEMLTGQLPFKGDFEQVMIYSILNEEPESITSLNPVVPQKLEWIVLRAMEKEKEDRYQDVSGLLDDLQRLKQESLTSGAIQPPSSLEKKRKRKRLQKTLIPTSVIVLLMLAFYIFRPQVSDRIPIAVASFENQTGDPAYDYLQKVIPNLLITKLEQSPRFMVNTWERMRDLSKQLNNKDVEIIDSELGFELCRLDNVNTIVLGSFAKAGEMFITDVKVLDVDSKRLLKSASSKGKGEESILKEHIDELGKEISRGVGLSDSKTGEIQRPIVDLTTTSLEAYYNFLRGRDNVEKVYYDDARQFLEKAVEIDPTFAMAYLYLAWTHSLQGNTKASVEAYEKANNLSKRTTDKEKLFIEALYAGYIEGDTEKQIRILRQMEKKYPKEKRIYYYLSVRYLNNGQFIKAIEEGDKALELDPDYEPAFYIVAYAYAGMEHFEEAIEFLERYISVSPGDANPYDCIGEMYWKMGRFDEAIGKYKKAIEIKADFYQPYSSIGYIFALKENYHEAIHWIGDYIDIVQQPALKAEGYAWKGVYEYLCGRFPSSLHSLEMAMNLAEKAEDTIWIYRIGLLTGWMYFDRDQTDLAYSCFNNAFEKHRLEYPESVNREVAKCVSLGQVNIKQGQIDSAMTRLAKLEFLMSEVSSQSKDRAIYQDNIFKSELLLAQNLVDEVIAVSEEAPPLVPPAAIVSNYLIYQNVPFCVDILARAYVEKGELNKAIDEYVRLINFNPDRKDCRLIHPIYHYRLAPLYEETGQNDEAISEYKKFLDIWKDADEVLPELIDAKARLAGLLE